MEDQNVVVDNSNTTEEVAPNATDSTEEESTVEESVEEVKARLAKAEELANNYKVRAEKAERKAKEPKETPVEKKGDLSSKDTIALINAKVHEEDVDEVVDYAKFKGISVTEALKSSTVKTLLSEKAEQRNVAAATNTGPTRRGSSKVSDDALISNASAGKLPDSDEEIARLMNAKQRAKS